MNGRDEDNEATQWPGASPPPAETPEVPPAWERPASGWAGPGSAWGAPPPSGQKPPGWGAGPVPGWGVPPPAGASGPVAPGEGPAPGSASEPTGWGRAPSPGTGSWGQEPVGLGPNTRCYEHPDRLAGAICRSCNRPICAVCMVQAPVGWHCHQCVRRNARKSPVVRYQPGTASLPTLRQTPVTAALIVINVAVFIASSASPNLLVRAEDWGYGEQQGQLYRLFTSMFFHYNVPHIALNMISLLIIGRLVEPALGPWRYVGLYLASGFGGSVAFYLLTNPDTGGAGASGAIFGLFGAYFVIARRARVNTSGIVVLIVINLVYGFVIPGIGWQDHVGGLITGMVVAAGFGLARGRRQELIADALVLVGTCAALALLMLFPPGVINLG